MHKTTMANETLLSLLEAIKQEPIIALMLALAAAFGGFCAYIWWKERHL